MRLKVLAVVGTRPEAVKMAPVVRLLRRDPRFSVRLCATAQHRQLLDLAAKPLGLKPDVDLDLMRPGQDLSSFLSRALVRLRAVLVRVRPEAVLAEGDTATVLAAALAALEQGLPFAHLEAGLRSHDERRPFPEEMIRRAADRLSELLFAPTVLARRNLLKEGVPARKIFVTGNTALDALALASRNRSPVRSRELAALFSRARAAGADLAVVTLHRREIWGRPMAGVFRAVLRAAERLPDMIWAYPVHPNPRVKTLARRMLRHPRVVLLPPLAYADFVALLKRARLVATDSGGIQEEAPSLGKPVVVVREKTERPEALSWGGARLAGVSENAVYRAVLAAARAKPRRARGKNPFGDGRAAARVRDALLYWAGRRRRRPRDFRA